MVKYSKSGHWQPTIPDQTCQQCAGTFTAHSYGQKFCSNQCKFDSKKVARVSANCAHCGGVFERRITDKDLTCSKECRYARLRKPESFKRVCAVCRTGFTVSRSSFKGITCSSTCLSAYQSRMRTGQKDTVETKAKKSAALKKAWADPDRAAEWRKAAAEGISAWHGNPENAEAFAERSSARMKARHCDPEFQARRDVRSSETMKKNWERYRELYEAQSVDRYLQMRENQTGLCSPEAMRKRDERAKWVLTKAQEALHAETDYDATYAEVQARLREESPYDAVEWGGDYMGYLQDLGRKVVSSPECRGIADPFLSAAFSRFSEEWSKLPTAPEQKTTAAASQSTP